MRADSAGGGRAGVSSDLSLGTFEAISRCWRDHMLGFESEGRWERDQTIMEGFN